MRVTFQIPEILLISSCVFIFFGNMGWGIGYLCASLFFALIRLGMEQNAKKDKQAATEKLVNEIADRGIQFFASTAVKNSKSNKYH
tara:strand:- start:264 stop:521 length:258 start_codon:yes stop_codon:yes gene_type:complete